MVLFDRSNNTGSIDVKMDRSVLEKRSSFKMLALLFFFFFSKLNWGSHIVSIAKNASKKSGALIRSMKFLSPEVALYQRNVANVSRCSSELADLVPLPCTRRRSTLLN